MLYLRSKIARCRTYIPNRATFSTRRLHFFEKGFRLWVCCYSRVSIRPYSSLRRCSPYPESRIKKRQWYVTPYPPHRAHVMSPLIIHPPSHCIIPHLFAALRHSSICFGIPVFLSFQPQIASVRSQSTRFALHYPWIPCSPAYVCHSVICQCTELVIITTYFEIYHYVTNVNLFCSKVLTVKFTVWNALWIMHEFLATKRRKNYNCNHTKCHFSLFDYDASYIVVQITVKMIFFCTLQYRHFDEKSFRKTVKMIFDATKIHKITTTLVYSIHCAHYAYICPWTTISGSLRNFESKHLSTGTLQ